MKADLKTPREIEIMREGGEKLSQILAELVTVTVPGITLEDIETKAMELINKAGGKAGFAMVPGYYWATCINVNEGVVHGIPNKRALVSGDVVSIDTGMYYHSFHTDMSTSFQIGTKDEETTRFLETGKKALEQAIAVIRPGNKVGHISQKIQEVVESQGYSIIYSLTGHGVGRTLHEYPPIPGMLSTAIENTPLLKTGMTLAIEVIYAQGSPEIVTDENDGWTINTKDGKIAAVFEKTIAVVGDGYLLITR